MTKTIHMLNLPFEEKWMYHPTVLYNENSNSYVLVDTGMPGQYEEILKQFEELGLPASNLSDIILTHQDIDHIGSLPQFIEKHSVNVYAHEIDKPYINGHKQLIKWPETFIQMLPENRRNLVEAFYLPKPSANVTHVIKDGDYLPIAGGLVVIHTPGHTPGHVSFYHEPSKTLITGDAMAVVNGELQGPVPGPGVTPDLETAIDSLQKFKTFPIETVFCYHGGKFEGNVHKRIDEITNRYHNDTIEYINTYFSKQKN